MDLNEAIQVLKKQGFSINGYRKIDNGFFFIVDTKENTLQNSFYIVTDDGLIKSGTDYYIKNYGIKNIET